MKVGLVSPYDQVTPGGVPHHVRNLSHWLRQFGHEVNIFAPSSRRAAENAGPDFHRIGRPIPIRVNDSVARITLSFHLVSRVATLLAAERFDVLHFHEPFMPAVPLNMLRMSTTANVGTFHAYAKSNLGYYYGRPLLKLYLKRLHATMAVSEPARDFVRHYFPSAQPRVVPNGIDVDTFRPGHAPIRHLRDEHVNVLFVGRLEKRKGLRDLLRAFQYLQARVARTRLIVLGDGPLRSMVESEVEKQRLRNVVMAGHVPNAVLPRYYCTADIFCSPATGGESFGMVLLEAMASGLPVVATEIPGYLSVLEPGVDSLAVRPKAAPELGAALTVLARDAELRQRLGRAGLAKAQRYSWPVVTSQVLEVYQLARRLASGAKEVEGVHDPIPEVG